jgi:hypothetical protein
MKTVDSSKSLLSESGFNPPKFARISSTSAKRGGKQGFLKGVWKGAVRGFPSKLSP